jgi:HSP20 family molecular chaperone IbpA
MVTEATAEVEQSMTPQRVPVNLYEAGDALVIVAPLPAVMNDDVTIALRPGAVTITASLRSAAPKDYLVHEWQYGGYERAVDLPDGFGAGIDASLANGQLAVRVLRGDYGGDRTIHPAAP